MNFKIEKYLFKFIDGLFYHFLEMWYGTGVHCFESEGTWKVADHSDEDDNNEERPGDKNWFGYQLLDLFGERSDQSTHVDTKLYGKESLYRAIHGPLLWLYKHHYITPGDSVKLLLYQSLSSREVIAPSSTGLITRLCVTIRALGCVGTSDEK